MNRRWPKDVVQSLHESFSKLTYIHTSADGSKRFFHLHSESLSQVPRKHSFIGSRIYYSRKTTYSQSFLFLDDSESIAEENKTFSSSFTTVPLTPDVKSQIGGLLRLTKLPITTLRLKNRVHGHCLSPRKWKNLYDSGTIPLIPPCSRSSLRD